MNDPNLPPECETALQNLITSHFDADSRECVITLIKLLDNILTKPSNPKVRNIRLGNAAFHERVGRKTGGIDFLLACGFERNDGLLTSSQSSTLDLTPVNESPNRLFAARRLLHSRALTLDIPRDEIPPLPRKTPPPAPTPPSDFDVYRSRSYNTNAAAHGADPTSVSSLDGSRYLSATERELQNLTRKRDDMEQKTTALSLSDRGMIALRPGVSVENLDDDWKKSFQYAVDHAPTRDEKALWLLQLVTTPDVKDSRSVLLFTFNHVISEVWNEDSKEYIGNDKKRR